MYQYQLKDSTGLEDPIILMHKKEYSQSEFQRLIRVVKFDLSHHVHFDDVVRLLCSKYGFQQLPSAYA